MWQATADGQLHTMLNNGEVSDILPLPLSFFFSHEKQRPSTTDKQQPWIAYLADDMAHQWTCHVVQTVTTHFIITVPQVSNPTTLPLSVYGRHGNQQQMDERTTSWTLYRADGLACFCAMSSRW